MSGAIVIPGNEPWSVAGWAFRLVLERAMSLLSDFEDVQKLQQAVALHGLHFKRIPDDQALRLARALFKVAADLQPELLGCDDSRDQSLAEHLVTLKAQLSHIYDLSGTDHDKPRTGA
jgi:hypothetical protein